MNEFSGILRRCADDYGMLQAGDSIAVGVSGGKDSLVLLCGLHQLQTYYPKPFTLRAITVDMGWPGMDFSPVAELCHRLDIPYTLLKTDIREIVFDVRQEENPCSLCAKMRRGALNNAMKTMGCNKLALGHHFDDAVETFMLSLLYEGRISCFKPMTYMSRAEVTQIRPMLYAGELRIAQLAEKYHLPVVENPCPADKDSRRREVKLRLAELCRTYPDLKSKIFGAMQRLPLEGWATTPHPREKGK